MTKTLDIPARGTLTIPRPDDPLDAAITYFGSGRCLAIAVGVTQQAVSNWRARGAMSYRAARAIERATGGQITIYDLDPYLRGE